MRDRNQNIARWLNYKINSSYLEYRIFIDYNKINRRVTFP